MGTPGWCTCGEDECICLIGQKQKQEASDGPFSSSTIFFHVLLVDSGVSRIFRGIFQSKSPLCKSLGFGALLRQKV